MRDVLGLPRTPRGVAERLAVTLLATDPRVVRLEDGRWTLAHQTASPTLDTCRFAVVDVETTGTSPRHGGRVVEIAVVELAAGTDGADARVTYETLINPERPIAPVVTRLTGITDQAVRTAPRFADVADTVLGALAGAVFVAHHVRFDWGFVAAELGRARGLLLAGPRLCTVRLARRLVPGLERRSLDALAHYFGFPVTVRHRAAPDARLAAQVLARLLRVGRERGARTLDELTQLR
ncbi:MAG TPA: 3'-5' exonuclease [Gemmatimonadales bacterium]|nr:3'-5' exonuclease [Gemmatimonadales bacterium]